jgi:leader peptidase (prepilin peptidase) / N-methyltransferase
MSGAVVDKGDAVLFALLWAGLGGLGSVMISRYALPETRRHRGGSVIGPFVIAGGVFCLLLWRLHEPGNLAMAAAFAVAGVPLAWEDAFTRRLSNSLIAILSVLIGIAVVAGTLLFADLKPLFRAGMGAAACLMFFALIYLLVPGGLGGGDVKLAAPLGGVLAWFSWPTLLSGLLLGWLVAALIHVGLRTCSRAISTVPLGPCLIGSCIGVILLVGEDGLVAG